MSIYDDFYIETILFNYDVLYRLMLTCGDFCWCMMMCVDLCISVLIWVRASSVHAVRGLICTRGQGPRLYTRNGFSVCTPLFLQLCILNTGYTTGLDMCKVCTAAVHSVALWTRVTLQVWTCVSMYRSSPFRSTFNTGCITGVDTCNIRTEAVHSVALWTQLTLQVWTCVSMYRSSPFRSTLNMWPGVDMCQYVPKQSTP